MSSSKKAPMLGPQEQKIQPKLRMVANGSSEVNSVRARLSCAVAAQKKVVTPLPLTELATLPLTQMPKRERPVKGELTELADDIRVNVFVETLDVGKRKPITGETARRSNFVTATVRLSQLKSLADREDVNYIEMGQPMAAPTPEVTRGHTKPPPSKMDEIGGVELHRGGEGVLIGIIDVQGFDFAHPDFLDSKGETRWEAIWDQGGDTRDSPDKSGTFSYGAEFRREHLNRALKEAKKLGLPPQELEHQSQMVAGSHGTHVASIAAGNSGVCPRAVLAGVVISLPQEDLDRRKSFYDSTRVVHAVDYLLRLADQLRLPVSINISLGTNGHSHDGSAAVNRWIDSALAVPGRCVSVAAGNAGQEVASFEGDIGYVMGRIHTSGRIVADDLVNDLEWLVVGNGRVDVSENELEIWYGPQDRFAVSIRPPDGQWIGPVRPLEYIENQQLADGSFLSIYNELYHPANGANWISIYLSPLFSQSLIVGIPSGQWSVRLHGLDVRDGRYHAWIERDDPRRVGRLGEQQAWTFPSFFSAKSNVDNSSVSSLACGHRVVSVANLDPDREKINITSSQGPTRDGRFKPDVAAPGTDIVAAKGFAGEKDLWVKMTGTSMASPYVAGLAGLMLAVEPKLTSAQVEGIIHRTSQPLPGGNFEWADDAGFGRINPSVCVQEAARVNKRQDRTP